MIVYTISDIYDLSSEPNIFLTFLQEYGLLRAKEMCSNCFNKCTININEKTEKFMFRCNRKFNGVRCNYKLTAAKGSWFDHSKLSYKDILCLTFCFVHDTPVSMCSDILHLSPQCIIDWYNLCREVCIVAIEKISIQQIGGFDKIVEIDSTEFIKRKSRKAKDQTVESQWVFGGVERHTNKVFMIPVEKIDKHNLIPIIKKIITPGTIIYSKCSKEYDTLTEEGYQHFTVNQYLTDQQTEIHTKTIENCWLEFKETLPNSGRIKEHFRGYLNSYLWKKHAKQQLMEMNESKLPPGELFHLYLKEIASQFNCNALYKNIVPIS